MREILHKARISMGNYEWVYGYYCRDKATGLPAIQDVETYEIFRIMPVTLSQHTYMLDKDNNEIWENDIVETENGFTLQCVWSEEYHEFLFKNLKGGYDFMIGKTSDLSSFAKGEVRIIGNIYDEMNIRKVG